MMGCSRPLSRIEAFSWRKAWSRGMSRRALCGLGTTRSSASGIAWLRSEAVRSAMSGVAVRSASRTRPRFGGVLDGDGMRGLLLRFHQVHDALGCRAVVVPLSGKVDPDPVADRDARQHLGPQFGGE